VIRSDTEISTWENRQIAPEDSRLPDRQAKGAKPLHVHASQPFGQRRTVSPR